MWEEVFNRLKQGVPESKALDEIDRILDLEDEGKLTESEAVELIKILIMETEEGA